MKTEYIKKGTKIQSQDGYIICDSYNGSIVSCKDYYVDENDEDVYQGITYYTLSELAQNFKEWHNRGMNTRVIWQDDSIENPIMRNTVDRELFISDLDEAKKYFTQEKPNAEEFLGEDFESYLNDFEEYMESIQEAESIEDLCDILNKYSDEFGNGSEYYIF